MWNYISNFWKFSRIFGIQNRLQMIWLVLGGILMSLLELVGISAIFPLLMLIIQPTEAMNNRHVKFIYETLHMQSADQLAMFLGFCIAILFIAKNVFQVAFWRHEFKVLAKWRIMIITKLYNVNMQANYETFMRNSSSHMINMITNVVPYTIIAFVHPMLSMVNYTLTAMVILGMIIYINWLVSIFIFFVACGLLFSYTAFFKKKSVQIGLDISSLSRDQYALLHQSFAGYKETRAHLKEYFFSKRFLSTAEKLAKKEEELFFLRNLPPAVVELAAMSLLLIIFVLLMHTSDNVRMSSAQIGVIVLACVRLLPIINRSINSITNINSSRTYIAQLFAEVDKLKSKYTHMDDTVQQNENIEPEPQPFNEQLKLRDVSYTYPDKETASLHHIDFDLRPGEFIGITGPSGGGKSTLINILMGHLISFKGSYTIDGTPINENTIRSLLQIIGHVDQQIFMMDTSIAENIAFGIEPDQIDRHKVAQALEQAQLLPFIASLPEGIDTPIGENGKFFSGGQKQRLAIARAFYRDLKILILDEASSSLDVETEYKLFNFLDSLKGKLSVIMIAHRLSTLQNCNRVYFIDEGKIADVGTFEELNARNAKFRSYIEYSQIKLESSN